ncbi:ABC transporter substrate-binding protein [Candidatus Dependentiae bacterium]|nr:ABC transporter substrate-binding protein [Candidatus Dependentiae bacterium]
MKKNIIAISAAVLILCWIPISAQCKVLKIGTVMIVKHPDLENILKGFTKILAENGYKENENIKFDNNEASGDKEKLSAIIKKFSTPANGYDLIFAITAPCAIGCLKSIKEIPIVYAAVKPSPVELGIAETLSSSGNNGTGQYMLLPIMQIISLVNQSLTDVKKVAYLYDKKIGLSTTNIDEIKKNSKKFNIEIESVPVEDKNDALKALKSLSKEIGAIVIDNDMEVLKARAAVVEEAKKMGIPVFSTNEKAVEEGAVATMTPDYYDDGMTAGKAAIRILKNEKPSAIPIEKSKKTRLIINFISVKELNLKFSPSLLKMADKLIK